MSADFIVMAVPKSTPFIAVGELKQTSKEAWAEIFAMAKEFDKNNLVAKA